MLRAVKQFLGAAGGVQLSIVADLPGLVEAPPSESVRVCIHAGPPVYASCRPGARNTAAP